MDEIRYKQNCYQILQVSPRASEAEIKRAYYRMAMKYHPDRNPKDRKRAEMQIRMLNEAYNLIRNSRRRKRYNALLRQRLKPSVSNDNSGQSFIGGIRSYLKEILWPFADTSDRGA